MKEPRGFRLLWIAVGIAVGAASVVCLTRPAPPELGIDPEGEPAPHDDEPEPGNSGFFAPTQ